MNKIYTGKFSPNMQIFIEIIWFRIISGKYFLFMQFCLEYDRTDQTWQEAKWERERDGGIRKGPESGFELGTPITSSLLYIIM